ncbi:MAG: PDZ domain-containing protein [Candidatus Eisenbacteria sp.]|nr:PDZ domain-containing protein [Candidatus Eisenbacteria bacterium]
MTSTSPSSPGHAAGLIRIPLACALLAVAIIWRAGPPARALPSGDPPAPYHCWLGQGLSQLYEEVSPAVVSVVSYRVCSPSGGSATGCGFSYRRLVASGVVISPDGCVVTTARVAQAGDSISVHFPSGRRVSAQYKGVDPYTHTAVLNLRSDKPSPYLRLATSRAAADSGSLPEWVAAVAYGPRKGSDPGRPSLTLAEKGAIQTIKTHYGDSSGVLWRIRAPFYPGNGGGALVSLSGKWIGLITGAVSGEPSTGGTILSRSSRRLPREAGVIVPAEAVMRAIRRIESGHHAPAGLLGVRTIQKPQSPADDSTSWREGVIVSEVLPESPAARYGLVPGDLIVQFDGQPVRSAGDLTRLIQQTRPGQVVRLELVRAGDSRALSLCLGDSDAIDLYLSMKRQRSIERLAIERDLRRLEREIHLLKRCLTRIGKQHSQSHAPSSTKASSAHP